MRTLGGVGTPTDIVGVVALYKTFVESRHACLTGKFLAPRRQSATGIGPRKPKPVRNQMTKSEITMTRDQIQTEALTIESLLEAAMAINGGVKPEDGLTILGMAHDRAQHLNRALDSVNLPEGHTDG